ncbi:MAG: non-homologous end-joining DNA ligase [Acidimicrobiales bacterium]
MDKVLYPATGFTKGDLLNYYRQVAPALLPHLAGRPVTLKRFPDGVDKVSFYEKNCPSHRPPWVSTVEVPSSAAGHASVRYCTVEDLATLVWMANLAAIELHPLLARAQPSPTAGDPTSADVTPHSCVDEPTVVAFDLDPGPPAGLAECSQVACWLREMLEDLGLASFPKTSGSKGLQVYVPLNTPHSYDDTKPFAHALARLLERHHPNQVVERMAKSLRSGKVLIDWSQNHHSKTTVSVYSLRALGRPTTSTPLTWDEVEEVCSGGNPEQLRFEAAQVLDRVERFGDLFAPVLQLQQHLPDASGAPLVGD